MRRALVLTAVLLAACGKKAPPIPPERLVPTAVRVQLVRNVADGVRLTWSAPTRTVNGKKLEGLRGFVVLRADGESRLACTAPGAAFRRVGRVEAEPGAEEAREYTYLDRDTAPGRWYAYRVLAEDLDGDLSNPPPAEPVVRRGTPPPPAPAPAAVVGDGFLTLRMPPFPPGVDGWFLYRAPTGGTLPDTPFFADLVTAAEVTDGGLVNGDANRYAAAWVWYREGFAVEGERSPWIVAAAADLVAPPAPGSLIGVAVRGVVDLRWERVEEPGVRYHVYRRVDGEPGFERLTREPVAGNTWIDRVGSGKYDYAVSSVDEAGNESPRGAETRVRVR